MIANEQIRAALEAQIDRNKLQNQGFDTARLLNKKGQLIDVVIIQSK